MSVHFDGSPEPKITKVHLKDSKFVFGRFHQKIQIFLTVLPNFHPSLSKYEKFRKPKITVKCEKSSPGAFSGTSKLNFLKFLSFELLKTSKNLQNLKNLYKKISKNSSEVENVERFLPKDVSNFLTDSYTDC